MVQKHSGLIRTYLPPFNLREEIPTVEEIIADTSAGKKFADHVALNHKGLNWKIFRFNLDSTNYSSFIYSFALIASKSKPYHSSIWQLESNARRLQKELKRRNIELTDCEKDIIEICKNFSNCGYSYFLRKKKLNTMLIKLKQQY